MRRRGAIVAVALLTAFTAAGCGGGDGSADGPTTTTVPAPSADALAGLVLPAAEPYRTVPDAEAGTGAVDPAVESVPYTTAAQLTALGFQRGWDRVFVAPDRSSVFLTVLAFGSPQGARYLQEQFAEEPLPGKRFRPLPGRPDVVAEVGRTPKGNASAATVVAVGRYAVIATAGGPRPESDEYLAVLGRVVSRQAAALERAQATERTVPSSTSSTQPRTSSG